MLTMKTVRLPFPFDRVDLFMVDVLLEETADRVLFRCDLYVADVAAPEGMILVKRGPVLMSDGTGLPVKLPPGLSETMETSPPRPE